MIKQKPIGFCSSPLRSDAVKKIPNKIKSKYPNSDWKKIAGFRDVLIHSYFKINLLIIWDVIENKLPLLKEDIIQILKELDNDI